MYFPTLFICWRDRTRDVSPADCAHVEAALRVVPGLTRALGFAPTTIAADQPYAADGRGPAFTLELHFASAAELEAAASAKGPLAGLLANDALPSLAGGAIDAQAMAGRDFATPDPHFRVGPGERPCTFVVEYPGASADPIGWLDHYDAHHPEIMVRFPGIREVATFRPAPEIAVGLPATAARSMQRNRVGFDSAAALAAALASPVMTDMRADSAGFAEVTQRPTHYPMSTLMLV